VLAVIFFHILLIFNGDSFHVVSCLSCVSQKHLLHSISCLWSVCVNVSTTRAINFEDWNYHTSGTEIHILFLSEKCDSQLSHNAFLWLDIVIQMLPLSYGPPAWGMGKGPTTPHHQRWACYEMLHRALQAGSCVHSNEPLGSIKGREFH
jgi:hypothetical protein